MKQKNVIFALFGMALATILVLGILVSVHAQQDMASGMWHHGYHPAVQHGPNATTDTDNDLQVMSGTCVLTNYTISKGGTEIVSLLPEGEHQPVSYILSSRSILEVEGKEDPVAFHSLIGSKCTVTVTYRIMVVHDFPVREIIRINLAA